MNDDLMTSAERKFSEDVKRIFGELETCMLPDAAVKCIDHFGLCEDGRTLAVTVELADGKLAMFNFCPGSPVTAHVVA